MLMAAVLLSSVGAMAQHEVGSFSIQPKVGMNIANATDLNSSSSRIGFTGGIEGEYQANEWLGLSAGVMYSQQGTKFEQEGSLWGLTANATEKVNLDYINVPILAHFYVTKGLALNVGVQPGFNVNSKVKFDGNIAGLAGGTDVDIKDGVNSFDFSVPMGVSYEYSNFVLDARYNLGVTKLIKDDYNKYLSNDSKNSVFQITLGYKFDL